MRFIRIGFVALVFGVSLAIVTLRVHPLELAARFVLFAMFTLVGLEVVLLGIYQVVTGRLVPATRLASLLLGARQGPTRLASGHVRLLGGLLFLVGFVAFLTAGTVWLSPA